MKKNFMLYMAIARGQQPVPDGWTKGPVRRESPIRRAIISQSKAITDLVASGGIELAGDVNSLRRCFDPSDGSSTDCDSNDVRIDREPRPQPAARVTR
jgi:hypothetical protein